jgi:hypothetical protein
VFKDVIFGNGQAKGNCDADLIVQVIEDLYEGSLNQAILIASDGDYAPLVKKLLEKQKLQTILSPSFPEKCSVLLKRTGARISYLNDQKSLLEK